MSPRKDFLITQEDVQNWQSLHRVLVKQADAIKELEERVNALENGTPETEAVKTNGTADAGEPESTDSDS